LIDVVLDQHEASTRTNRPQEARQELALVAHEVERVGHQQAVQRRELEFAGEVGLPLIEGYLGESLSHGPCLLAKRPTIPID